MAAFLARPSPTPVNYEITDTGNSTMKVVVRLRPENEDEIRSNNQAIAKVLDEHVLVFDPSPDNSPSFRAIPQKRHVLGKKHKDLRFAFDKVFDETASQVDVFEHTTKSIVDGVLEGINCSVFAYGATGAGKTYTMLGTVENPGIMFLTMMELYTRINEVREEKTCDVAVSYCEVYNETIRDLIMPSGDLHLREDSKKGLVVTGLSRHIPTSANDVLRMLETGNENRTQHPTDANATSSRSHAVFQVFVNQKPRATGLSTQVMQAKMSLIDLAGSERATATKNRGERLTEGANINKSLLALGNCINALADNKGKSVHVPYRNSKLTRLLKDSLGGNCRTVMIANISPSGLHLEDTYNTLRYSDRAKQIKTKLVPNVLNVDYHVTRYRTIVEELQKENSELKSRLDRKCPKDTFDPVEALRLQGLVKSVYGERSRLRKRMAELDASERETLLKICRKERDLSRVNTISGDESRKTKISARIESLHTHVTDIQRQKQTVNEYLYSNNESVGRVQAEINRECGKASASPALRQLLDTASEARRLETENAHLWKQTKHLLKYIKNQEKEINKSERILIQCLSVVRRQHTMLRATNGLTPILQEMYDTLVRMAEGEKGVAWADQSLSQQSVDNSLMDVSTSSFSNTQVALFDNFVTHASPVRKMRDIQAGVQGANDPVQSPNVISASLGILASSSVPRTCSNHIARCSHDSPALAATSKQPSRPTLVRTPSQQRTPHLNGLSTNTTASSLTLSKPGTTLFVASPRTAFTPKNYLKFHPLSENHSNPKSISFSPRFHARPEVSTPTVSRTNSFTGVDPNSKPTVPNTSVFSSPKPLVSDSGPRSTPKSAFLSYTPLSLVNKPRAPTPIDDGSWSSNSSSTYSTKLNTVLNRKGYYEPERRNAIKRGNSFLKSPPQSDSGSSVASTSGSKYLVRNKTKRPEPYLLPRPNPKTNPDLRPSSLSRASSFNGFEDNFVSVNSVHVKTPVGVAVSSLVHPVNRTPLTSTADQSLLCRTSPTHSPSPPSSSVSSQSQLSLDNHSTPPPSAFSSLNTRLNPHSSISNTLSFRPLEKQPSKALPVTSPVTATTHMYNPVGTTSQYQTLTRIPASISSVSNRTSPPTNLYNHLASTANSPPLASPTKPKNETQLPNKISPSRRAKSAESLLPQSSDDSATSPPLTPVHTKRSVTPSSISGKFARAKKLFGIRKNVENGYHRTQSTSLTDVSQKPHSAPKTEPDGSDPHTVSLSDGDGDSCLNSTYVVEPTVPKSITVKHAFPVARTNGTVSTVDHKQHIGKDRVNGMNGLSKRRGIFGNRSNIFSNHHVNGQISSIEDRLQSVESAQQRVVQEAINGGPVVHLKKLESQKDNGRKVPNYLQMTKASASKRVSRPQINKENKGQQSIQTTVKVMSKSKRLLSNRPRDRDVNGGAFKSREVTATPQLVW